ncbi:MAG TPA: 4Fe-4S dicluster domain-containing protein [Polyangiaceae bacterium]
MNAPLVKPRLLKELKRYGAIDISACFNCGNCSAVCPLSEGVESFPRRVIRLGQLGRDQDLLASDEPWLCHYCGECTRTCPRKADPGEYMAAVRRWTIAQLEPTGLGKLLLGSTLGALWVTLAIATALGLFLLRIKVTSGKAFDGWLFRSLVQYGTIHAVGIAVGAVLTISLAVSVARFSLLRRARVTPEIRSNPARWRAAMKSTLTDVVTARRHRSESRPKGLGWLRDPWFIHSLILGGFSGLLVATALDFVVLYLMERTFHLSVFWPARVIGTVAGLALLDGVTLAIVRRVRHDGPSATTTRAADGWLLFFLLILALTGFWIEIAVTFAIRGPVNDWVLLLHSVMAMELVLLLGATKLAHALYRPLALLFMHLRRDPAAEVVPRGCAH